MRAFTIIISTDNKKVIIYLFLVDTELGLPHENFSISDKDRFTNWSKARGELLFTNIYVNN